MRVYLVGQRVITSYLRGDPNGGEDYWARKDIKGSVRSWEKPLPSTSRAFLTKKEAQLYGNELNAKNIDDEEDCEVCHGRIVYEVMIREESLGKPQTVKLKNGYNQEIESTYFNMDSANVLSLIAAHVDDKSYIIPEKTEKYLEIAKETPLTTSTNAVANVTAHLVDSYNSNGFFGIRRHHKAAANELKRVAEDKKSTPSDIYNHIWKTRCSMQPKAVGGDFSSMLDAALVYLEPQCSTEKECKIQARK